MPQVADSLVLGQSPPMAEITINIAQSVLTKFTGRPTSQATQRRI